MYPPTRKTVFLLPEGLQDIFLPLQERCGVLRFIGMRSVEEQLRSCSPSMCSCDGVLSPATEVRSVAVTPLLRCTLIYLKLRGAFNKFPKYK